MQVIFLSYANSQEHPLPTLQEEDGRAYQMLARREAERHFRLHRDSFTTIPRIAEYLALFQDNIAVFHYSGHAGKDRLLLGDAEANAAGIAQLLGRCPNLKLAVLNGCSTKGQVQALLEAGVPAVIATSAPVEDHTAAQFAITFYQAMADSHRSIGDAFQDAAASAQTASGQALKAERARSIVLRTDDRRAEEPLWGLYFREESDLEWKLPLAVYAPPAAYTENSAELAHDSLAALIDRQRTDEQRQLNEVKRRLAAARLEQEKTGVWPTERQLLSMEDFLPKIRLAPHLQQFVQESHAELERQKQEADRERQRKLEEAQRQAAIEKALADKANAALAEVRSKNNAIFRSFTELGTDLIYTLGHAESLEKMKVAVEIEVGGKLKKQHLAEPIAELLYFFAEGGRRPGLARAAAGLLLKLEPEAEWELAARGGVGAPRTLFVGSDTLGEVGWSWENSGDKPLSGDWGLNRIYDNNGRTHAVKEKRGNGIGIYDMSGNVYEWCWDWYDADYYEECRLGRDKKNWLSRFFLKAFGAGHEYVAFNPSGAERSAEGRVIRGGSWIINAGSCRVVYRDRYFPDFRFDYVGFRLAFVP